MKDFCSKWYSKIMKFCKQCALEKENFYHWKAICVDCCSVNNKTKYQENRQKILYLQNTYNHVHKKEKDIYNKGYIERNKANKKTYNRDYQKSRRKKDIYFKIMCNLRSRLNSALKGNYKAGSAVNDLECSIEDLKIWIEQQFQDKMTWQNYGKGKGKWNIDHIVPLTKVDIEDTRQFKIVCHWFNLRPLWNEENVSRGNRI